MVRLLYQNKYYLLMIDLVYGILIILIEYECFFFSFNKNKVFYNTND